MWMLWGTSSSTLQIAGVVVVCAALVTVVPSEKRKAVRLSQDRIGWPGPVVAAALAP
ncbi:hypothetical protein [Streptomyces sp. NPDC006335]|uniref:hypothetical protein n=1 Tax=Streptomyces sp. NPDC006335 TaxID=3156895 RepID=UPI0033B5A428